MDEIRKMCGGCRQMFAKADFPVTTAYGKPVVRSWCRGCLKLYYQAVNQSRRKTVVRGRHRVPVEQGS